MKVLSLWNLIVREVLTKCTQWFFIDFLDHIFTNTHVKPFDDHLQKRGRGSANWNFLRAIFFKRAINNYFFIP